MNLALRMFALQRVRNREELLYLWEAARMLQQLIGENVKVVGKQQDTISQQGDMRRTVAKVLSTTLR